MGYQHLGHQSVTTDFCCSLKEEPLTHSSTGKKGKCWKEHLIFCFLPLFLPQWANQTSNADFCSMFLTSKHTVFPSFPPYQANRITAMLLFPSAFWCTLQISPLLTKLIGLAALEYMECMEYSYYRNNTWFHLFDLHYFMSHKQGFCNNHETKEYEKSWLLKS